MQCEMELQICKDVKLYKKLCDLDEKYSISSEYMIVLVSLTNTKYATANNMV